MAHDSQIVRAKENLKLSYGGPSQGQTPGTNHRIKALRQGHHWVWGLTHHRAIKEETIEVRELISVQENYVLTWHNLPVRKGLTAVMQSWVCNIPRHNLPASKDLTAVMQSWVSNIPMHNLPASKDLTAVMQSWVCNIPRHNLPARKGLTAVMQSWVCNIPRHNLPASKELTAVMQSWVWNIPRHVIQSNCGGSFFCRTGSYNNLHRITLRREWQETCMMFAYCCSFQNISF